MIGKSTNPPTLLNANKNPDHKSYAGLLGEGPRTREKGSYSSEQEIGVLYKLTYMYRDCSLRIDLIKYKVRFACGPTMFYNIEFIKVITNCCWRQERENLSVRNGLFGV